MSAETRVEMAQMKAMHPRMESPSAGRYALQQPPIGPRIAPV
jgi:hypothetical protein